MLIGIKALFLTAYNIVYEIKCLEGVMATQAILAEKTVSISDFRKEPSKYFTDEPIAVLSNNKTAGYVLSPEAFQAMVSLLENISPETKAKFRPSKARLESIAQKGAEILSQASEADLGDFAE